MCSQNRGLFSGPGALPLGTQVITYWPQASAEHLWQGSVSCTLTGGEDWRRAPVLHIRCLPSLCVYWELWLSRAPHPHRNLTQRVENQQHPHLPREAQESAFNLLTHTHIREHTHCVLYCALSFSASLTVSLCQLLLQLSPNLCPLLVWYFLSVRSYFLMNFEGLHISSLEYLPRRAKAMTKWEGWYLSIAARDSNLSL